MSAKPLMDLIFPVFILCYNHKVKDIKSKKENIDRDRKRNKER